ncbi:hypothetical protein [uncultured Friedmanniella sp.]|uniref:hypothetical protein n=1 Tax=uncultured Friedmanniella sp. TaxID=335381 RepID=UPI0035CA2B04
MFDQPLLDALKEQGGCEVTLSQPSVTKAAKQLGQARVDEEEIDVTGTPPPSRTVRSP